METKITRKNIEALIKDERGGDNSLVLDIEDKSIPLEGMYHLAYGTNRNQEQFFVSSDCVLYERQKYFQKDFLEELKGNKTLLRAVLIDELLHNISTLTNPDNASETSTEFFFLRQLLQKGVLRKSTLQEDIGNILGFGENKSPCISTDLSFYLGDSRDYVPVKKSSISRVMTFCRTHPKYAEKLRDTIDSMINYRGIL